MQNYKTNCWTYLSFQLRFLLSDSQPITDELSELPTSIKPPGRRLSKRDSSMSILSSCSVESDWSDEELEELEKVTFMCPITELTWVSTHG